MKVRKSLNKESGSMGFNPRWAPQANLASNMPSSYSSLLVCKTREFDFNNASGANSKEKSLFLYFLIESVGFPVYITNRLILTFFLYVQF